MFTVSNSPRPASTRLEEGTSTQGTDTEGKDRSPVHRGGREEHMTLRSSGPFCGTRFSGEKTQGTSSTHHRRDCSVNRLRLSTLMFLSILSLLFPLYLSPVPERRSPHKVLLERLLHWVPPLFRNSGPIDPSPYPLPPSVTRVGPGRTRYRGGNDQDTPLDPPLVPPPLCHFLVLTLRDSISSTLPV